jgi:hypothetical protein
MAETAGGGSFPELFEVVRDYARRDHNHQVKALRVIAAAYLPLSEVPPMPDARQVVEDVLARNDFLVTDPDTGQLEPASIDAVVSVATSRLDEEDLRWGAGCLLNVMDALRRRTQTILAADIVEDVIEDAAGEG